MEQQQHGNHEFVITLAGPASSQLIDVRAGLKLVTNKVHRWLFAGKFQYGGLVFLTNENREFSGCCFLSFVTFGFQISFPRFTFD